MNLYRKRGTGIQCRTGLLTFRKKGSYHHNMDKSKDIMLSEISCAQKENTLFHFMWNFKILSF